MPGRLRPGPALPAAPPPHPDLLPVRGGRGCQPGGPGRAAPCGPASGGLDPAGGKKQALWSPTGTDSGQGGCLSLLGEGALGGGADQDKPLPRLPYLLPGSFGHGNLRGKCARPMGRDRGLCPREGSFCCERRGRSTSSPGRAGLALHVPREPGWEKGFSSPGPAPPPPLLRAPSPRAPASPPWPPLAQRQAGTRMAWHRGLPPPPSGPQALPPGFYL